MKFLSLLIFSILASDSYDFSITKELGKKLLYIAKKGLNTDSTTSCRKEQKSVIHKSLFPLLVKKLDDKSIKLHSRDNHPSGGRNITLTFYGKKAVFENDGVKTKIRFRIRFYLQRIESHNSQSDSSTKEIDDDLFDEISGTISNKKILRSIITDKLGFIEIKIKNPSASEVNGVIKLRMLLNDNLINKLISEDFSEEDLLKFSHPKNKASEASAIINIIRELSKIDPQFSSPQFGISYERDTFQIRDNFYEEEGHKVDYQMTLDSKIEYHKPKLPLSNIEDYLDSKSEISYPLDSKAFEFKDPYPIAGRDRSGMSPLHRVLLETFVDETQSEKNMFPGMKKNKGKAGHYLLLKEMK